MAHIQFRDKLKLEELFRMESGYVLNFSNSEFFRFVTGVTGRDIRQPEYEILGTSKANRLRAFWDKETESLVGTILLELIRYASSGKAGEGFDQALIIDCTEIAKRLHSSQPLADSDVLSTMPEEMDLDLLASTILEAMKNDRPETAIDRLHTYTVRYLRRICQDCGVVLDQDVPLHSLLGSYIRYLRASNHPMTTMSERILKSSISTLEAYNEVRNNYSLAHDNPVLDYNECLLILNHVVSIIKFIKSVESRRTAALTGI